MKTTMYGVLKDKQYHLRIFGGDFGESIGAVSRPSLIPVFDRF